MTSVRIKRLERLEKMAKPKVRRPQLVLVVCVAPNGHFGGQELEADQAVTDGHTLHRHVGETFQDFKTRTVQQMPRRIGGPTVVYMFPSADSSV